MQAWLLPDCRLLLTTWRGTVVDVMLTLRRWIALGLIVIAALSCLASESMMRGRGFVLASEPILFDAELHPRFTANQVRDSAASTRDGLAKWAATREGRTIIARFLSTDREVEVIESADELSIGRAPQPGFMTLLAADDHTKVKTYQLILNPSLAAEYNQRSAIDLGLPRTPAEVMALAWAGEMLHVDLYAKGIPLPHHQRADFQERWRLVADALGLPRVPHVTDGLPGVR
jgi:hypothetical protein